VSHAIRGRVLIYGDYRILSEKRRPIGYLNVQAMKEKFARNEVRADDPLREL
jgi:hypothetical protein